MNSETCSRIAHLLTAKYDRTGRPALLSRTAYDRLAREGVDLSSARMLEVGAVHIEAARP